MLHLRVRELRRVRLVHLPAIAPEHPDLVGVRRYLVVIAVERGGGGALILASVCECYL